MHSHYYLDLELLNVENEQPAPGRSVSAGMYAVRNRLYGVLHGVFRQYPGRYALALPLVKNNQPRLRVFAERADQLEQLSTALQGHPTVRDYARLHPVVAVDQVDKWVSYRRYRIPTVKSDRHAVDGQSTLRDRRLAAGRDLEHFQVGSQSTGQRFTLMIQQVDADQAGEGIPDGYGLARASQPFAVPDLP